MHRPQTSAAIIAFVATAMTAARAAACSCGSCSDLSESLVAARNSAEIIFRGRVTSLWGGSRFALFEVQETFKGVSRSRHVVRTQAEATGACEFPFEVNREYLVYAWNAFLALETSLCSRTAAIERAGHDLAYLRGGKLPNVTRVRRERVSCDCEVESTAARLSGTAFMCGWDAWKGKLAANESFWEYGDIATDRSDRAIFGISAAKEPFELRVVPAFGPPCSRRVFYKSCKRLDDGGREAVCRDPSPESLVCDSQARRRVEWLNPEPAVVAHCSWGSYGAGDTSRCSLDARRADAVLVPPAEGETLWCAASDPDDSKHFYCLLSKGDEIPPEIRIENRKF